MHFCIYWGIGYVHVPDMRVKYRESRQVEKKGFTFKNKTETNMTVSTFILVSRLGIMRSAMHG